ncbi:MAG: FapA family protein, partial [Lachnospiraceae bacterium]|nr:FapA family protein [Lachnospiraceae bacterium]
AELVEGSHINQTVVVAEGKKPVDGSDGYYEFFFKTDINREPKILDDGSLDYQNIEWFEQVVKDQKLAYYHSATSGEEGCTVLGANIQPKPGMQLPVITGEGFRIDGDNKTYISNMTGLVEYTKGRLVVTNLMVLDEINSSMGNVVFDGSISVRGNVQTGSYVSCTGDLYVSGAVEGAVIDVDGEIIIKQGINASRKGSVKSKKSISARFIESANVRAEGSITVNYILNSIVQSRSNIKVMGRKGSIIGGVTYATKEIEVHQVGNDAFVKTLLKVGLDDEMVREQVRIEKQIKEIDKNLESLNLLFNQLNETFTGRERESNDTYVKIESAMFNKNKEKKELLEAKAAISKVINQTLLSKVVISGMAYENSIVEVNGKRWASKGVKDVTIKTSADSTVKVEAKW